MLSTRTISNSIGAPEWLYGWLCLAMALRISAGSALHPAAVLSPQLHAVCNTLTSTSRLQHNVDLGALTTFHGPPMAQNSSWTASPPGTKLIKLQVKLAVPNGVLMTCDVSFLLLCALWCSKAAPSAHVTLDLLPTLLDPRHAANPSARRQMSAVLLLWHSSCVINTRGTSS